MSNERQFGLCIQNYGEDSAGWGPRIPFILAPELLYADPRYGCDLVSYLPPSERRKVGGYYFGFVDITSCPAVLKTDDNRMGYYNTKKDSEGQWINYLYGGYAFTYGYISLESKGIYYFYGFNVAYGSIRAQCPNTNFLGKKITHGATRTLFGPSVQPMLGDEGDRAALPGGGVVNGVTTPVRYAHNAEGMNMFYLDGHGRWFDQAKLRNMKADDCILYTGRSLPLDF